jgi:hypothetical protein
MSEENRVRVILFRQEVHLEVIQSDLSNDSVLPAHRESAAPLAE